MTAWAAVETKYRRLGSRHSLAFRIECTFTAISDESFLRLSFQNFKIGVSNQLGHDACMKVATIIARVLLGLVFVVFGSNIFLHFIPMPPPPPGLLGDFSKALFLSHYLHVVAVFQIVGGLLLLFGRFVPLGLLLLAPVIVNIDLVHILLDPSGLPMAVVISILLIFLVWRYREAFKGILSP
jgi:putative oxidoreductase